MIAMGPDSSVGAGGALSADLREIFAPPAVWGTDDLAGLADRFEQPERVLDEDGLLICVVRLAERLAVWVLEKQHTRGLDALRLLEALVDNDRADPLLLESARDQSAGLIVNGSSGADKWGVHAVGGDPASNLGGCFVQERLDIVPDHVTHEAIGALGDAVRLGYDAVSLRAEIEAQAEASRAR